MGVGFVDKRPGFASSLISCSIAEFYFVHMVVEMDRYAI